MMKATTIIVFFMAIFFSVDKGYSLNSTNFVFKYLLKEHAKCQTEHDVCHQAALGLLTSRGFHSFYEASKKCKRSYETCLRTFQRQCEPNCQRKCPKTPKANNKGNGNDCLAACSQMCK